VFGAPTLLVDGEVALAGLQPEALLLGAISRAAGAG
jgi:predicted DsbA family dithiol-disulfide isomerase